MVYVSKAFDKLVQSYPETIKCKSQNKPITEVFSPKSDAWDTPKEIQPEDRVVTLASGYKSKLWNMFLSLIILKVPNMLEQGYLCILYYTLFKRYYIHTLTSPHPPAHKSIDALSIPKKDTLMANICCCMEPCFSDVQ